MKEFAKQNLKAFGFDKEVDNVEQGYCPFCSSTKTNREDFKDSLSWKEFQISGMCMACQNKIFN